MEIPGGNLTVTGKLENGEFINWGDYHPSTFTGLIQGPFPTWILYHANMAVNPAKKVSPKSGGNDYPRYMFTIESCVFGLCIPRILLGSCWPYFPMKIPSFYPFFVDLKRLGGLFLSCTKRKRPLRKQLGSNDDKLPVGHLIHNFGDGNLKRVPIHEKVAGHLWYDRIHCFWWGQSLLNTFPPYQFYGGFHAWLYSFIKAQHACKERSQEHIYSASWTVEMMGKRWEKHIWLQNVADFGIIILYHGTIQMVHKSPPCPMVFTTSSESMMQPAQVPHTGLGFRFSPSAPGPEVKTSGETLTTRTALSEWNGQDVAGQSQMKCWQPPMKTCHVLSPKMFFYM